METTIDNWKRKLPNTKTKRKKHAKKEATR